MIPTICADAIDLQNNLDSCRSDYGDEQINPTAVGADVSRPPPIYGPAVDFLLS